MAALRPIDTDAEYYVLLAEMELLDDLEEAALISLADDLLEHFPGRGYAGFAEASQELIDVAPTTRVETHTQCVRPVPNSARNGLAKRSQVHDGRTNSRPELKTLAAE